MANFGQGAVGAATGFATGGPVGAAIGGFSGLLGLGQPHEDPQMKAMRQNQLGIQNNLLQYARSVPGSSQDELANLSQARGQLGAQQRQNEANVFQGYNPNQGLPAAQMRMNLGNANIAQQMALSSGMLQNAAASRRQALLSAANVGTSAAEMYKSQPSGFPAVAAQLSQQLAYQNARNKGGAGTAAAGASPAPDYTQANAAYNQAYGLPAGSTATGSDAAPAGPVAGVPQSDWGGAGAGGDAAAASIQGLTGGDANAGMSQTLGGAFPDILNQMQGGIGGMPPELMRFLPPSVQQLLQIMAQSQQQPGPTSGALGQGPVPASAPGLQGSMSPGNEPFGNNGTQNQLRQSNKVAGPPPAPTGMLNPGQVHEMLRMLIGPGGVRQSY